MNRPEECRLCKVRRAEFPIVGEHVSGGRAEQKFYECPNCDVAFLFPPPTEEEEKRFYAQEFERYMKERAGFTGGWESPEAHIEANRDHVLRRMRFLEEELRRPSLRVLEIGCSSGFMLLPLRERGLQVEGIEPSGVFGEFVRSRGIPVFDSLDQYENEAAAGAGLDVITHFFLLEHISSPVSFLKRCLALLRPTGKMFFEVPSRSDPLISIYNVPAFQEFYWSVAHHWYFNRSSLMFVLNQLGCKFEMIPEQRYDLSNHLWWALAGKPGGAGKFSLKLTDDLEKAYKESMRRTGYCDTYFVWLEKAESELPSSNAGGAHV